jgi:hypothetical protein
MSRTTGGIELVPLQALGGSNYRLQLTLDGGTGDLFKFNTGAPFVPEPGAAGVMGFVLAALNFRRRQPHRLITRTIAL